MDLTHHSHHSSSSSPQNTVCVLTDHQPVNHQETERSDISEITESVIVNAIKPKRQCAQNIISMAEDQRAQMNISKSNTEVIEVEIHSEETDAQHVVHFEDARDRSDAGSLITQSNPIHATINALSTWISAVQPRESWYLAGWIKDSPIDFLVDPGAVVSAISLQCYDKLVDADAILTPLKAMQMELEAANKSDMRVQGMCSLELSVHRLLINIDAVVVDLNCQAILGMDILGDATKLPFILDLVDGTLSGGGYETIQLHRFHAATECFAETTDPVCIPPHSEVMLWAKLKTNNGRRGPTAGVVLALQSFVQEFGLLVGRSLVRADAEDWKIPILLYISDPCTKRSTDCTCNPVIIPARTRIARVEEIQAIQNIGTRETERSAGECALPPHLLDVLDAASDLTSDQRACAADLLAKHINTFPAPGTPITGRTDAVVHEIDTGSTRPIRCNPRKLSPKKIKIQQELVDKMLEGQIEHSVSAWSAPTVLVTKKDGTTRFCVDYRRLNARTKKDAFPLPRIDDSLNSLSGQAWLSTLDLASGYWQVILSEDAKPKTAFATHSGLFQFAVMPFGLCNAPATFERLMSQVMRGLHWKRKAVRYHPVTEEVTPPITPPRAHAVEQNVVQDTPSPVQKPGRSRGHGTWRAPQKIAPGVGTRSRTRQAELEQIEAKQALAARAEWPPSPDQTRDIQRMTRELHLCDVPRDAHKELQKILPDLDENQNQNFSQPPAAGLMTQHQDVFFIPPPRVVGGARGISAPVSTATLGLIHRHDPSLAAQLREDPRLYGVKIRKTTCLQHDAPHSYWHVGPTGFPPTMGRGDASSG